MVKKPSVLARLWSRLTRTPPQTHHVRRFQAARIDNLTAGWLSTASSINEELRADLDALRTRGRDLVNNNDYARKFRGMVADNIIGPGGIRLQVRVEDAPNRPDRLANMSIEASWLEWCQGPCDLNGTASFRDMCEQLIGSMPSDGEFLVRMVKGPDARNRWNFAIQIIDVDRIDTSYNTTATNGNTIITGVEVDAYGRPVALHLFSAHPSDGPRSSRTRTRVEVGEVLHRFKVERAEQKRGIPWMAPGMLSLHHLGAFKLAALLAAEHGANHFGFFQTPDGQAPAIGVVEGTGDEQQMIVTTQPGTYDTLPPGVTFHPHESRYPDTNFGPFVKTTLQRIASGWRVAYHSLANDLEGVSFSSIRSGTLEERDRWSADQEWFIGAFVRPVYLEWLRFALLSGAIRMPNGSALPAAKFDKFSKHEWQPRRWDWVDPKSDMEANIMKVRAGLISPQDLAASMGYDYEDTLAAIKRAKDLAAELGVDLNAYDGTPGASKQAAPAEPAPATKALEDLTRALIVSRSEPAAPQQITLQLSSDELRQQNAEMCAQVLSMTTNVVRELATELDAKMDRLTDNYRQDMQNMPIVIPAPIVNVAAPNVNVEAVMPAAQVVVQHPTRAVQTVQRDSNDEIVSTTTEYSTQESTKWH